jgi:hypothetical protein
MDASMIERRKLTSDGEKKKAQDQRCVLLYSVTYQTPNQQDGDDSRKKMTFVMVEESLYVYHTYSPKNNNNNNTRVSFQ